MHQILRIVGLTQSALIILLMAGCQQSDSSLNNEATNGASPKMSNEQWIGTWRAVLESPGGDLPFALEIEQDDGELSAWAVTGPERLPFSGVGAIGDQLVLRFDWYDAEIVATRNGEQLSGEWHRTSDGGEVSRLDFRAQRGDQRRFLPRKELQLAPGATQVTDSIAGRWSVMFTGDDGGTEPAEGEFEQQGGRVTGTFITPTGDYRFLEGSYEDGLLRLSTFDGAHAFLFSARVQNDGSLIGDFWSRDSYHANWTGVRIGPEEQILPDAWELAQVTSENRRFRFDFDSLDGPRINQDDPRFAGKVVMLNLFGTWCPNCADEAPLLAEWYRRYREQGLEVVGLAFEYTGEPERDKEMIRRYAQRHGTEYPLLLAGLSVKADAAAVLPDLDRVVAYPTTIFVGRDGTVRKVHSGFSGPGAGARYQQLIAEFEDTLEKLLAEAQP